MTESKTAAENSGILGKWNAMPLYVRIVIAMFVGMVFGLGLGERAMIFEIPSKVILQLLGALAPPLILVAVTHVLMTTDIKGKEAVRLAGLLLLNTTVAIVIGLGVANLLQPGAGTADPDETVAAATVDPAGGDAAVEPTAKTPDGEVSEGMSDDKGLSMGELLSNNLPKSILGPLGDQTNIIGVIIIAVAFGIALRDMKESPVTTIQDLVQLAYDVLLKVLHWVIYLIPLGVFCIVAHVVGHSGFDVFFQLSKFILAVLLALSLQTVWYLVRIRLGSRFSPLQVLKSMRDALVMAFSTDSSTITMPVTYACLKDKLGVDEEAASMGSLVGANFNNDGTALYEAMAALFVAQMIGMDLGLTEQLIVVFTSIIASVGAAGIPEAGLVTMTLVFTAVGLPIEKIGLLLTVDWFLDRCRTTINVLGDVNVSCLLDGKMAREESVASANAAEPTKDEPEPESKEEA